MTIRQFAKKYRLRITRPEDGDLIIAGRLGHISTYGDGKLALVFVGQADDSSLDETLRTRMGKAEREGFASTLVCEFEGIFLFNPTDPWRARLAWRLIEAPPRKRVTKAQLRALGKGREAPRNL